MQPPPAGMYNRQLINRFPIHQSACRQCQILPSLIRRSLIRPRSSCRLALSRFQVAHFLEPLELKEPPELLLEFAETGGLVDYWQNCDVRKQVFACL
jgi:hypothetical protein